MYSEGEGRGSCLTTLNSSGLQGTFTLRALNSKGCPEWIQIHCQAAVTDPLWVSSLAKWTWSKLSHNINATSAEGLEHLTVPTFAEVSRRMLAAKKSGRSRKALPTKLPPKERPFVMCQCWPTARLHFFQQTCSHSCSLLVQLQKENLNAVTENKQHICLHMQVSQVTSKPYSTWQFLLSQTNERSGKGWRLSVGSDSKLLKFHFHRGVSSNACELILSSMHVICMGKWRLKPHFLFFIFLVL